MTDNLNRIVLYLFAICKTRAMNVIRRALSYISIKHVYIRIIDSSIRIYNELLVLNFFFFSEKVLGCIFIASL